MIREGFASVNGVDLHYAEGPDSGPPLLLMPGFPDPWRQWVPIIPTLATRWHVFALSIRGMDRSGGVAPYRTNDLVEDVIAFVRDVVGEPAFVVGHSGGAVLSASAAGRQPELFRGLVIGDVPLDQAWHLEFGTMMREFFVRLGDLIRSDAPIEKKVLEYAGWPTATIGGTMADHYSAVDIMRTIADLRGMDADLLGPWVDGRLEQEVEALFSSVPGNYRGPIMFLCCDPAAGGLLGPERLETELTRYPWAQHAVLAGASHGMGLYQWDVGPLLKAVTAFLEMYR